MPANLRTRVVDATAHVVGEINATHVGGFAVGHSRKRRGNGKRDATRAATYSTVHKVSSRTNLKLVLHYNGDYQVVKFLRWVGAQTGVHR